VHEHDAVDLITDAARWYGSRLTLVVIAPLTNIALAIRQDRAAMRGVGHVVVMAAPSKNAKSR
jgi:purine nucleosidase